MEGKFAFQNKVRDKRRSSSPQSAVVFTGGSPGSEGLAGWQTYPGSKGKSSLQQGETTGQISILTRHRPPPSILIRQQEQGSQPTGKKELESEVGSMAYPVEDGEWGEHRGCFLESHCTITPIPYSPDKHFLKCACMCARGTGCRSPPMCTVCLQRSEATFHLWKWGLSCFC